MIGNSEPWQRLAEIVFQIADDDAKERRYHAGSLYYQLKTKRLL